jgi:ribonucleoside-triphosphate reductase (thioredoxin)
MLKSGYEEYIHKSRYARYLPSEQRRESWRETVERYVNYFVDRGQLDTDTANEVATAIYNCDVMPSMRAMMTAGKALDRDNVAGFNCSYLVVDHPRAFDELMYILMCGTGVGFSVERQYVSKLPEVAEKFYETDTVIHVADSKVGWAKSYRELISLLYSGQLPKWDVSGVRAAGAALKTFGGRASGPEPLTELFRFTVEVFKGAAGRKLNSIECHDICCKVAQIVVVGGVRRSALISLSNLTDDRIRRAKHGQWWLDNPHRGLANNSACYTEKPDFAAFLNEWSSLYESRSGERGFFSRVASQKQAAKNGRRDASYDFGTNPCSEIILRPNQFCNLSEVVVRPKDTLEHLERKVRIATILGTLQATLTDFRYLRSVWKKNTEEEALLGVSLTGIMDHPFLNNTLNHDALGKMYEECEAASGEFGDAYPYDINYKGSVARAATFFGLTEKELMGQDFEDTEDFVIEKTVSMPLPKLLEGLKEIAIETNKEWAEKLGINQSAAITCVKPSGTVSQLVDSASGIHARFAPYYIRRVRADMRDPLCKVLEDAGVPCETDVTSPTTKVFSFPKKAPEDAVFASEETGMSQLRLWDIYQKHWCEHKPSITVYYRDKEFLEIGQWMYNNFDSVSGVSFLPYSEHTYEQAPYEAITEEKYNELMQGFPTEFEWDIIEQTDLTEGAQTLACIGGSCEL